MKPPFDITLSAMFKRIAYDASEQAIGDTHEMMNRLGECPTEEYSEHLADNLLKYYEDELRQKEKIYNKNLLDPERLFINGWDLREDIEQIKAIIEILKTNTNDNRTHPLEKTEKP